MAFPALPDLPGKFKPYLMAHRGNRVACPENTLAAFQRAIEDGADILETDLHLSSDGAFMCIHDASVDRTTNGSGAVAEKTLVELKSLSAFYGRAGFEAETIPTLKEVAAVLPSNVALALELKTDRFLEPEICKRLAGELLQAGVRERTMILSFSLERLRNIQRVAPDMPIGLISMSGFLPNPEPRLLGLFFPFLFLNPFFVRLAHARNQAVCPLDPLPDKRLGYYLRLGCDAILSDNPAATREALLKRQRHPSSSNHYGGEQ